MQLLYIVVYILLYIILCKYICARSHSINNSAARHKRTTYIIQDGCNSPTLLTHIFTQFQIRTGVYSVIKMSILMLTILENGLT